MRLVLLLQLYLDPSQPFHPTRGYSSFRFVPGTHDFIILAIKSEEVNGKIATCILSHQAMGHG